MAGCVCVCVCACRRQSPLLGVYWLRMVIDEGHVMGSSVEAHHADLCRELVCERRYTHTHTHTEALKVPFFLSLSVLCAPITQVDHDGDAPPPRHQGGPHESVQSPVVPQAPPGRPLRQGHIHTAKHQTTASIRRANQKAVRAQRTRTDRHRERTRKGHSTFHSLSVCV